MPEASYEELFEQINNEVDVNMDDSQLEEKVSQDVQALEAAALKAIKDGQYQEAADLCTKLSQIQVTAGSHSEPAEEQEYTKNNKPGYEECFTPTEESQEEKKESKEGNNKKEKKD